MRFHRSSEPSSADHSARTLKKVGVARLELEATYSSEKSFDSSPTSITAFATTTSANSEYAVVRALSMSEAFPLRTPTTETTAP